MIQVVKMMTLQFWFWPTVWEVVSRPIFYPPYLKDYFNDDCSAYGIEECVNTIMSTLPVCKVRGIAYSTFTIIKITNNTYAEIIQYDNPLVILLRNGKKYDYPTQTKIISGKKSLNQNKAEL